MPHKSAKTSNFLPPTSNAHIPSSFYLYNQVLLVLGVQIRMAVSSSEIVCLAALFFRPRGPAENTSMSLHSVLSNNKNAPVLVLVFIVCVLYSIHEQAPTEYSVLSALHCASSYQEHVIKQKRS